MTLPIPLVGPSYKSRSIPLSAQVTKGFYLEVNQDGRVPTSLHSFPGLKEFAAGNGVFRGFGTHQGTLYVVLGSSLYMVSASGSLTTKAGIPGGGRCILQSDGYKLFIATGTTQYVYDTSLSTVAVVDSGAWNAFLNSQMVYSGADATFWVADPGEGETVNGLNYATAEADPDGIVRGYVYNDLLYLFGERVTETWYNSGVGNPPFDRITGGTLPLGCGAKFSIAHNDQFIYLLGDDRIIYQVKGQNFRPVTSLGVSHAIDSYLDVSDASGMCVRFEGQDYYVLTFNSAGKTWVYCQANEAWFELGYGVDSDLWRGAAAVYHYGKTIVADHSNGKLYTLDLDTFTDNGTAILRQRDTAPIHSGLYGEKGKRLFMSRLELIMETGTGLVTGQGADPRIMMQFSDDGGITWSSESMGATGALGQYQYRVEWFQLGMFFSRIFRFKVSDPIKVTLFEAIADMEAGR